EPDPEMCAAIPSPAHAPLPGGTPGGTDLETPAPSRNRTPGDDWRDTGPAGAGKALRSLLPPREARRVRSCRALKPVRRIPRQLLRPGHLHQVVQAGHFHREYLSPELRQAIVTAPLVVQFR